MVPSYSHHISWSMTWTGYLCATGFTVDSRRLTDFSVPLKILSLTKADALLLPHVVSEQSLRLDCVEHHRHRLHLCHCPPSRTSFRTSTTWGRWTPTCTTRPAWTRSTYWGRLLRKRNTTLYIILLLVSSPASFLMGLRVCAYTVVQVYQAQAEALLRWGGGV